MADNLAGYDTRAVTTWQSLATHLHVFLDRDGQGARSVLELRDGSGDSGFASGW